MRSGRDGPGDCLRSVDRLHLSVEKANRISLAVTKEKAYPRIAETSPLPDAPEKVTVEATDAEGVKRFALLVEQTAAERDRPPFSLTRKVADMVAGGEYRCLTAVDPKGEIVGGILFGDARTNRALLRALRISWGEGRFTGEALLDACSAG